MQLEMWQDFAQQIMCVKIKKNMAGQEVNFMELLWITAVETIRIQTSAMMNQEMKCLQKPVLKTFMSQGFLSVS